MRAPRAGDHGVFVCYTNQVGGQDELVFDGGSMVLSPEGGLVAQAAMFEEELLVCDLEMEEAFAAHLHDPRRRQNTTAADVRLVALSEAPFLSAKPPLQPPLAAVPGGKAEASPPPPTPPPPHP